VVLLVPAVNKAYVAQRLEMLRDRLLRHRNARGKGPGLDSNSTGMGFHRARRIGSARFVSCAVFSRGALTSALIVPSQGAKVVAGPTAIEPLFCRRGAPTIGQQHKRVWKNGVDVPRAEAGKVFLAWIKRAGIAHNVDVLGVGIIT
jgi:hypothetical protein